MVLKSDVKEIATNHTKRLKKIEGYHYEVMSDHECDYNSNALSRR